MGRELKRVPLDFSWPINKTWGGYLNPHLGSRVDCPACAGTGRAPDAKRFGDEWYGYVAFDPVGYGAKQLTIDNPALVAFARRQCERNPGFYGDHDADVSRECRRLFELWRGQWVHHLIQADVDALLDAGRLMDFTHVPRTDEQRAIVKKKIADGGNSWLPEPSGYRPTAEEVNNWSLGHIGHDAINRWICISARCVREGVPETCATCGGDGNLWPSADTKAAYEAWQKTEPPTGDGFQLWTTTTEGDPISPVFASLDELCAWAAENASTFGSATATAEQWRSMLDAGFVHHTEGNMVFI